MQKKKGRRAKEASLMRVTAGHYCVQRQAEEDEDACERARDRQNKSKDQTRRPAALEAILYPV